MPLQRYRGAAAAFGTPSTATVTSPARTLLGPLCVLLASLLAPARALTGGADACAPGGQTTVEVDWARGTGGELGFLVGQSQELDPAARSFGHTIVEAIGGDGRPGSDWVAFAERRGLRVGDALLLVHGRDVARRGQKEALRMLAAAPQAFSMRLARFCRPTAALTASSGMCCTASLRAECMRCPSNPLA